MKNLLKNFGIIFIFLLVLGALFSLGDFHTDKPEKVGINKVIELVQNEQVKKIEAMGGTLIVTVEEDGQEKKLEANKEPGQSFSEIASNYGIDKDKLSKFDYEVVEESGWLFWLRNLIPYLFPIILILGLIYFMSRQVQGVNNRAMGFGQSSAKQAKQDDKSKKTFKDVAGCVEAKEELQEVVEFLKTPQKFADMGAKIPKGLLLMGAPGIGKTLLARAVAGEAGVPFFHISGSEFVEMFVGVGASRVRDLFSKAKKSAPAIIFIDEIDAVGRKRGAGLGGSHDEREQTLNQILVEMDGFDPHIGVIVIGATNRPDVLDQALLRPGRFDRRIVIDKPDINDREAILQVHAKGKPLNKDVSLRAIAERTPGFTGADLDNLLNEAAILAVRNNMKEVTEELIKESIEKVMLGPEKRSRIMSEKDREMTAYHEAGHAIVGHFMKHCDPVRKVSIIGRGMAGGYTFSTPEKDLMYKTLAQFRDEMAMSMGGYVAERMIYGDENLSTGPSSDLKKATQLATAMVKRYGMSDILGPRMYGDNEEMIFLAQEIHDKKNYSEKTAERIDEEINRVLKEARDRAEQCMKDHKKEMDNLVKLLLKKETVEQDDFASLMEGKYDMASLENHNTEEKK
ncbi:MAG: cell division protein FtsH [Candidatus Magasanikbacteria bacterium CG11_big_fil_rev_8_21_14_0_20_39_34]|uniref:ATP-dependent zinc metalloprotease FtsH n=1 Tax=Candidatus Magasanikbacteria bacterium CG11_big_fil_rev_8_21_14_0_20_39_34 TaxID=1974653 RepID=A0A2H0N6L3_9BACT|nr:MAG: cell division protein FtsH [Candidatus Magasanikbacteria bacterium CG11_big_fil_rev_8_21_14_0_20_39_34]